MKDQEAISGYRYSDATHSCAHAYLMPAVNAELHKIKESSQGGGVRLFDLGCGNGSVAASITKLGWEVSGVDPSSEGISAAAEMYPDLHLKEGSAYDDLVSLYGRFPVVVSLEVVEHVYAPREYARTLFDLVEPGGAGSNHFDALSWLSQELGHGRDWQDGYAFYGTMGSWAYQILVGLDPDNTSEGRRFR